MKRLFAKISLFFLVLFFIFSCDAVKRLDENQQLLEKNEIFVNGDKISQANIYNQLDKEPNTRLLGIPLRLHFYNLARPHIDSVLNKKYIQDSVKFRRLVNRLSRKQFDQLIQNKKDFNAWIKRTGEAPVTVRSKDIQDSEEKLKSYYWNNGWFNVETKSEVIPLNKEKRPFQWALE